jgi:hypothetical protein
VAGRLQNALGDMASLGERLHSLLSWRDPRYENPLLKLRQLVMAVTLFSVLLNSFLPVMSRTVENNICVSLLLFTKAPNLLR